jgi:hypothetical protein
MNLIPKRNIVFFSIDCRRADLYETFNGHYASPNLTRMAERGIVFENMYTPAVSTVMTLDAIINGRYAHQSGRVTYPVQEKDEGELSLFRKMKKLRRKSYILFTPSYVKDYADGIFNGDDAERVVINGGPSSDRAREIIKIAKETEEPFLIFSHNSVGKPKDVDTPASSTPRLVEHYVKEDDDAIGLLLDELDLSKTTIVFYSDHGFLNGEHGHLFMHAFFLYEPVVRVPCIVTADEKQVVCARHSLIDLNDLLTEKDISPPKCIYADTQYKQQFHRITMVIEDDWKYMAHYSPDTAVTGRQEELYDLKADPHENRNLLYDIAKHPLRYDWNQQDMASFSGTYLFKYDREFLNEKANVLKRRISRIWINDFISILNDKNTDRVRSFIDNLKSAEPSVQLKVVSDSMCKLKSPCWYGGGMPPIKDGNPPPQPPMGFPGLPKNF